MVSRIYVEKKPGFDVEAQQLRAELASVVTEGLAPDARLRIVNRYDVEGLSDELFERCVPVVFPLRRLQRDCTFCPKNLRASIQNRCGR